VVLDHPSLAALGAATGVVVVGSAGDRARLVDLARTLVAEGARQGFALKDLRKLLGEVS